jgi:hypothetical protein
MIIIYNGQDSVYWRLGFEGNRIGYIIIVLIWVIEYNVYYYTYL